ncbi:hypothetical protein PsorP6_008282 [Peronosclerospora sorghi]|uniref:Uncharacterized protein n=1 Tax=Peronosclerospora sorghi TaxID=230839 RepID=A0ACC0WC48_9STRA|nr:hypothetical protein PsorP6_008282 [Peronosclerospora sorghi]
MTFVVISGSLKKDVCDLALSEIHHKRWRFLDDVCSVIVRQILSLSFAGQSEKVDCERKAYLVTEGISLCLDFIERLINLTVSSAKSVTDESEITNQRGVLVAALLHLFAKIDQNRGPKTLKSRLVDNIFKCGVDIHVILATLRFRQELITCHRVLLPSHESVSESGVESDEDEENEENFEKEDMQWIVEQVAKVWGLTNYQLFLQKPKHECACSTWSDHGIKNLIHTLLLDDEQKLYAPTVIVSPYSWLFHVAAYAHNLICLENHQDRISGLNLLRVVSDQCPQGKLTITTKKITDYTRASWSFEDLIEFIRARDWMSPLIQVITNAMVSFPETNDRSMALEVLRSLLAKLVMNDRFWLLRSLLMKCPYANVSAVLMDFIRQDAVATWSWPDLTQTPFKTPAIWFLLHEIISQAAERDLALQADLLASCLSLVRFLLLRDESNITEIRSKKGDTNLRKPLSRIMDRLQVKMNETMSSPSADNGSPCIPNEMTRFLVLEAALCSTMELL